jgi:probable rRNA maturation factor
MKISVSDETGGLGGASRTRLSKVAGRVLRQMGLPSGSELSLSFIDDRRMRELNRDWRNINRATDVLSFPQEGGPDYTILGDIVISLDTAERHSVRYGCTLHDELKKLIVHGVLHLLGYDHKKKKEKEIMREMESRLLSSVKDY